MAQYFTGYSGGGHRPGGGMGSNKVVERSAPKAEPRARAVSPAAVSQLGGHLGDHATGEGKILPGGGSSLYAGEGKILPGGGSSLYAGPGYSNVGPRPTQEGPGGGRTVMHCGSQDMHGAPAGRPFEPSDKGWSPPPGGIHRK
jgi:hypothetical protein